MFQNGFVPAEVDIGGCDVVQALVVVVVYEGFDLSFNGAGQEVYDVRVFGTRGGLN